MHGAEPGYGSRTSVCSLERLDLACRIRTGAGGLLHGTRSALELANYRAKRGTIKKLRDEVVPFMHYVKFAKAKGDIRFELNNGVPDCWLRDNPNAPP